MLNAAVTDLNFIETLEKHGKKLSNGRSKAIKITVKSLHFKLCFLKT